MTPTQKGRRSDALYMDTRTTHRRQLCDMVVNREADIEDLKEEIYGLQCDIGRLENENAKLWDALKALMMGTHAELCADRDQPQCRECSMSHGKDECAVCDAMELLGIDMFGEPLGVEVDG